jgi:hypothetical protein
MKARQAIAAAVVAVAVAWAAYLAGNAGTTARAADGNASQVTSWPPRPWNVVNVCIVGAKAEKLADGNQGVVAYTVPGDRKFVLTDAVADIGGLFINEQAAGKVIKKISLAPSREPIPFSSTVGVVFAPGSQVVLYGPPDRLTLIGYLTQ